MATRFLKMLLVMAVVSFMVFVPAQLLAAAFPAHRALALTLGALPGLVATLMLPVRKETREAMVVAIILGFLLLVW